MRLEPLIAKKFEMKGSEKSRQSLLDDDGDVQVNQGYTFSWVYNPNGVSGFTGVSWFDDVDGSPLNYSGITAEEINSQFENSNRQDLNDIFRTWQDYLALNDSAASDFAKYLTLNNAYGCWR